MATQRISQRELYTLRNAIPIDQLIRAMPSLSAKESEGVLRFLCPLCLEFNTATNPRTNLARCFRCNKNFNTIDLVMQVQDMNFKDAVAALSSRFQRLSSATSRHSGPPQSTPVASDPSRSLTSIRHILESALAKTESSTR
jgi:DNA primase